MAEQQPDVEIVPASETAPHSQPLAANQMALEESYQEKQQLRENLESWKEKCASLEGEVTRLRNELSCTADKKDTEALVSAKVKIDSLQMMLEENAREKQQLQDNLESWKEKCSCLERDVAQHQDELTCAAAEKIQWEQRMVCVKEEASVKAKELEDEIKRMEERLSSADEQERMLTDAIEHKLQLEENIELLKAKQKEISEGKCDIEGRFEQFRAGKETEIAELLTELEKVKQQLQEKSEIIEKGRNKQDMQIQSLQYDLYRLRENYYKDTHALCKDVEWERDKVRSLEIRRLKENEPEDSISLIRGQPVAVETSMSTIAKVGKPQSEMDRLRGKVHQFQREKATQRLLNSGGSEIGSIMSAPCGYRVPASDLKAIYDKLLCSSCCFPPRLAVQTECGHLYCEACLALDKRQITPACTAIHVCGTSLDGNQWFPDHFQRREITDLNVSCSNVVHGCHWDGKLKLFDDHQNKCSYRPMRCGNDGCTSDVPACQLVAHVERECRYRRVVCRHCNSPETVESLQDHLEICPDVPVSCAKCGKDNIPRSQNLMSPEALTSLSEGFNSHLHLLVRLLERCSHQSCKEAAPPSEGSVSGQDLDIAAETHSKQLHDLDGEVQTLVNTLAKVAGRLEQLSATNAAQLQDMSALKNLVGRLEATINALLQLVGALFRRPQHSMHGE